MKPKSDKTLADFVVIAFSPVLIMALVGSLVFFLAEVLYVGQYQGSLQWILFFFVFGAVLVARIAIEFDAGRAALYGFALGLVTWLGMLRFVEYPSGTFAGEFGWAINLGLLGIIWWSANRLTWDCTMIDETQDASGEGLLQAAGLEDKQEASQGHLDLPLDQEKKPKKKKSKESALGAWWRRYQLYRAEKKRRPHVPGVWVVYFSLAALPLYGLGQALIPPAEVERRRYVFWLMSIYVASGLGLLLTTSFLGLRRYLRQKKVQMPAPMTGVWLFAGVVLIAGFLLLGALLPRPAAEYPLIHLPWRAGSKERDASHYAKAGDEAGKGEGRPTGKGKDDSPSKGDPGSKRNNGKGKGDGAKSTSKDDKAGSSGTQGKGQTGEKGSEQGRGSSESKKTGSGDKEKGEKSDGKGDGPSSPHPQGRDESSRPNLPRLPSWTGQLSAILKWIVLGLFGLLIIFFGVRAVLMFLANFTGWANSLLHFFRTLWRRLGEKGGSDDDVPAAALNVKPVPFSAFRNPFLNGQAEHMATAELVRYTFEALQAWAAEHDQARQMGETPLEFAQRLGQVFSELAEQASQLANYYASLAYARHSLSADCRNPLHQLWHIMAISARGESEVESSR